MDNQFDMRCPKCGESDSIEIEAKIWVRLMHDGTDEVQGGCTEWDDDSLARCDHCDYEGKVKDFEEVCEHEWHLDEHNIEVCKLCDEERGEGR